MANTRTRQLTSAFLSIIIIIIIIVVAVVIINVIMSKCNQFEQK
jgi:preprotein translocase subunit SecE